LDYKALVMKVKIRKAKKEDIPQIIAMIKELATYERASQEVTVTARDLEKDGFGNKPVFEVLLAFQGKEVAGMAFFYISYSTWKGKCLYLEDIIVKEQFRRHQIGHALFAEVIKKPKKIEAKRLHWQVLNWNEPAINFYKKYSADIDANWLNGKLTENQLKDLNI